MTRDGLSCERAGEMVSTATSRLDTVRRRRLAVLSLVLAFAAPATALGSARPAPLRRLSNERTRTTWAHPAERGRVRTRPALRARVIARLRPYTEDGFPEVYVLLASRVDSAGRTWVLLRVPGRPNGRVGWVRRVTLGGFHVTRDQLVVDRRRLRARFFVRGRRVWQAPVGIGKRSTPTPAGHFWIREVFRLRGHNAYGPYAFGTSDYSVLSDWPGGGVIGVHGDLFAPGLIPGRPSHGCIRLHDGDDAWLGRHMHIGTPLLVR